jgi:hypothetical protein
MPVEVGQPLKIIRGRTSVLKNPVNIPEQKKQPYLVRFEVDRASNGYVMQETWFGKENVVSIADTNEKVLGRLAEIL